MKKKIIITGGELFNKGAQSMTFVTIDELKNRYPNHDIILLSSMDYKRNKEELEQYKFEIRNLDGTYYLIGGVLKLIWKLKNIFSKKKIDYEKIKESRKILINTDFMIDISGYALSSQRGFKTSIGYLTRIMLSKKYNVKFYIMPQSFGPFNYGGLKNLIINILIKLYMKYPEIVYAREKEGFEYLLNKYKLNNVKKENDLVINNKSIKKENIYFNIPKTKDIKIENNSIALIPNMKNFKFGNTNNVIRMYMTSIDKLLNSNRKVYLIRHSYEDIEACRIIKSFYKENDNVVLLKNNFSCFEYENIIKHFDFAIASRYHSIIHAYKNGIPCIAIGWATKYHELLINFEQEKYIFDVRKALDYDKIEKTIDIMIDSYKSESNNILILLKEIQKDNIFDVIGRDAK